MSRAVRLVASSVILGACFTFTGGAVSSLAPARASTLATHASSLIDTARIIGPDRAVTLPARSAAKKTTEPKITLNPVSVTAPSGTGASFKARGSGKPTPKVQWEISTNSGSTFTPISGATKRTYSFTTTTSENGDEYEAVFTNSVGTATTTAATLTVTDPPTVTTDPSSVTITSGDTASFTAAATGTPTPTVQWEISTNSGSSFTPISDATSTTYSFTAATSENGDEYEAVFTNSVGTATTTAATLTVTDPPTVTTDPSSVTITSGDTASFTAAATGTPTPTVQWEISTNSGSSFTPISDATSTTYSFTAATSENGDEYEAVFTNSVGTATTTAATLTVTVPTTTPVITTDPSSITVSSGDTASFTAAATGTPTPTVQWEISTNSGSSFTPISDATSTTYSFTAATSENGDEYEAVFTNSVGTATTTAATLTVTVPTTTPVITTDPSSITVSSGDPASFTAAATGTPTPTVQWEISTNSGSSFTPISDATSTTYSFTAATSENGDEYEAVFTNSVGTATTTAASLTVTDPPTVTTDPSSITVSSGDPASFTAAATGTPTPTVQWEISTNSGSSFTPISDATSTTYSFTAATSENGDEYEAVFTNSVGTATTTAATLTVTTAPSLGASENWSGYAATGSTFNAVAGSWTAPSVTCTGTKSAYSAEWVGIDGDTSSTVEQDGTEADCLSGTPSYDAWYELYGDSSENGGSEIELSTSSYPVDPGDAITASVSETNSVWTFGLKDVSTEHSNWTFTSAGITFSAAQSSAEWIIERPELCSRTCSLTSLADFGTTTVSNASATTSGLTDAPIDSFSSEDIEMVNTADTYVLALPSSLGSGGNNFTDTWEAAS